MVDDTRPARTALGGLRLLKLELGLVLVGGRGLEGGVRAFAVRNTVLPRAAPLEAPPLGTETDASDKVLICKPKTEKGEKGHVS